MPKSSEFLFVNGRIRDRSTALGRIIADLQEPDPDLIQTEALRRRMKMLKNSEDGRKNIGDLLEEYVNEMNAEAATQANLRLLYSNSRSKENDAKRGS